MRLPFGLGRRSSSGSGASGGSSDAGSTPTVSRSASSGSGAVPARPRAWASLPPIQRAAGTMPQVAAPSAFVGGLPGTQGLPPVVQQLGHEVSPMATPGLVVARVRAVEQSSSGSIPKPVQRRASRSVQRQESGADMASEVADVEPAPAAEVPVVAQRSATSSGSSGSPSASRASMPVVSRSADSSADAAIDGGDDELGSASVAAPEIAPVRSLPTVSRSAIHVPDRPLTSAAAVVRPTAQRSHAGHPHASSAAPEGAPAATAPLPAPSGGMRRAQSSTVISRSAMPTVSRTSSSATATATSSAAGPASTPPTGADLPVLPAVGSRRGVGEPTALPAAARPIGAPESPSVSRSAITGAMPLATSTLRTTIQRAADDAPGEDDDVDGDAPVQRSIGSPVVSRTPTQPSLPVLPVLPVSRSASGSPVHAAAQASTSAAATGPSAATTGGTPATSAPVQRSAASTAPTIRPIAAHNPLRPAVAIQRDADDDAGDDDAGTGVPSPWWAPADSTPALPQLAAIGRAGGSDGGPGVQRSAFASAPVVATSAAAGRTGGHATTAPGPTHTSAAVQRSARAGATSASPAQRLPLAVPSTTTAAASPAASGGVPDWHAPGTTVTFPQRSITSDPTVQTSRASGAGSPAAPTVQRDPTTGGTSGAPAGTSGVGSQTGAAARQQHSERDLDELARQLFGRIRTRLRADLLQDREAAGFTFDNV